MKIVSILDRNLFVLAMAFEIQVPVFLTPLTINFASTFSQKSIVNPSLLVTLILYIFDNFFDNSTLSFENMIFFFIFTNTNNNFIK